MGALVYNKLDSVISSIRWSINRSKTFTEMQLVWLEELIIAEEFRKHPEWCSRFDKPTCIRSSLVGFNDPLLQVAWKLLTKARNKAVHEGLKEAESSFEVIYGHYLPVMELVLMYNVNIDWNRRILSNLPLEL